MRTIRIGTRDSKLALWQANHVGKQLIDIGLSVSIIPVKSEGDLDLVTPLYQMGVQGVFTKTLDAALLNDRIDIAVHSMKDVPVILAQGLYQAAVLPRANAQDFLITRKDDSINLDQEHVTIGTGSLRRKAQWLHKYPHHTVENLRGNLQTRLNKLDNSSWHGAIFAAAGLDRLDLNTHQQEVLEWMIPAPAQGAIMVACRATDSEVISSISPLNHDETELCTHIERQFLHLLEGGCSAPIGAHAYIKDKTLFFKGSVTSTDGSEHYYIEEKITNIERNLADTFAKKIKELGAQTTLDFIRQMKK